MITADSSMIDTSGQLVVVEKVETNLQTLTPKLQTLTPSIPTLAPNPKHASREQTNLEYPNLDRDTEKWMMHFRHTI